MAAEGGQGAAPPRPQSVKGALAWAATRLRRHDAESARLDAEVLLADVLALTRERLYAEPERMLTDDEHDRYVARVTRRERGEPVAYIVGRKAFRGIELRVDDGTLIPRPETETLVDVALEKLAASGREAPRLLDLGTGSGAIALAIAGENPAVRVVATDVEARAIERARLNAQRLGLASRVECMISDVYSELPKGGRFDVIVSNPPYIADGMLPELPVDVRGFEPHVALLGGEHGLDFYQRIVPGAPEFLEPGGWLAVEIGLTQAEAVTTIFSAVGRFSDIELRHDLGGRPRVVLGRERP